MRSRVGGGCLRLTIAARRAGRQLVRPLTMSEFVLKYRDMHGPEQTGHGERESALTSPARRAGRQLLPPEQGARLCQHPVRLARLEGRGHRPQPGAPAGLVMFPALPCQRNALHCCLHCAIGGRLRWVFILLLYNPQLYKHYTASGDSRQGACHLLEWWSARR